MNYNWNFLLGTCCRDSGVAVSADLKWVVTFHRDMYVVVVPTQELLPYLIAVRAGLPPPSNPVSCNTLLSYHRVVEFVQKIVPDIYEDIEANHTVATICFNCGDSEYLIEAMITDTEQKLILEALKQ